MGALASTAITVGGPLVIQLFQHIFDAIWQHAHPSTTVTSATATAATTTSKVLNTLSTGLTITPSTVTDIVNTAVANGTINAPGSGGPAGSAIGSITTLVGDAIKLGESH